MQPKKFTLLLQFCCLLFTEALGQISFEQLNVRLPQLNQSTVKLADYDNDGDLDIAVAGERQNSKISSVHEFYIYRNDSDGEFVEIFETIISSNGGRVNWGDINNDGLLDVFVTGLEIYTTTPRLYIFKNLGDDKFEQYLHIDTEKGYPNLINCKTPRVLDINRDGFNDMCCLDYSSYPFIHINNGTQFIDSLYNRFIEGAIPPLEVHSDWADFNRDGYPDFVFLNNIYKNNGDSTFSKIEFSEPFIPDNNYWVDLDADGFSDIVSANNIYKNINGVNFEPAGYLQHAGAYSFADFNNDGFMDVLSMADYENKTMLMINKGDMSFAIFEIPQLQGNTYAIDLGDLDNDGDIDVVAFGLVQDRGLILLNQGQWSISESLLPNDLKHVSINNKIQISWESPESLGSNLYIKNDQQFIVSPGGLRGHNQFHTSSMGNLFLSKTIEIDATVLPEDGLYEYAVQSVNSSYKSSRFTDPLYFTFYRDNALDAPTELKIINLTINSASFSWLDNSLTESSYIIEIQKQSLFEEISVLPPNSTSYTFTNLKPNTQYTIRVKSVGSVKHGFSSIVRFSTPSSLLIPFQLQVSTLTKSSIVLKWSYTSGSEDGFVIERATGSSSNYVSIGSSLIPEFTDSNVEVGTNYSYRVKAYNESESSKYSDIIFVTFKVHKFEELLLEIQPGQTNGMAWGDFNNDGFEDLFIAPTKHLYKNNGDETFTSIENSGIGVPNLYNSFAIWGDVDNDGFLDLFIGTEKGGNHLFKNMSNGTFKSMQTVISTKLMFTSAAAFVDYDNDGDVDLFVSNSKDFGNGLPCYIDDPSYLYRNEGKWEFVLFEVTDLTTQKDNSTMPAFGDLDNNGFTDLVFSKLLEQPADICPQWHGTEVYFNDGSSNAFIKDGENIIAYDDPFKQASSWSAVLGDFDNDLQIDVITTYGRFGGSTLYKNSNGRDFEIVNLPSYTISIAGAWVDFDNDTDKDIYLSSLDYDIYNHLYQNKNNEFTPIYFGDITYRAQEDLTWIDLNNDGFLDLISRDSSRFFNYFRNIPNDNNWVKIQLKGSPSNTFGVGAKVFVKTKYGWQYDFIVTTHSYKSQKGYILNFGLKDCTNIDSVKVVWPMGTKQYLTNIAANQTLVIEETNASEIPLYKPSNLKSKILSPRSVEVSWTVNSKDHTGFIIKRSTGDESNYKVVGQVRSSERSYIDETVSNTGKYYYIVQAEKGSELSDQSASSFVKLTFPDPTELQVALENGPDRKLTWDHLSLERNVSKYKIERSLDGSPYKIIGESIATSFIDRQELAGLMSYRVNAIFSNTFVSDYSNQVEIIVTGLSDNKIDVSIYPNPANDQINIISNHSIKSICIDDLLGKRIYSGSEVSEIDVSKFKSGLYVLKISIGENEMAFKILIQR